MGRFQQFQMGRAMTAAAENPSGGGAAEGMGLGMGFAMASQMMQGMGAANAQGGGGAPPNVPTAMFHIVEKGQSIGPFSIQQMQERIAAGIVTVETLVWSAGMANWMPAGRVPGLSSQLSPPPPPPPA